MSRRLAVQRSNNGLQGKSAGRLLQRLLRRYRKRVEVEFLYASDFTILTLRLPCNREVLENASALWAFASRGVDLLQQTIKLAQEECVTLSKGAFNFRERTAVCQFGPGSRPGPILSPGLSSIENLGPGRALGRVEPGPGLARPGSSRVWPGFGPTRRGSCRAQANPGRVGLNPGLARPGPGQL